MTQAISRPDIRGVHHLKLAVADLGRALKFYEEVLGARRDPALDHRRREGGELYAHICDVSGLGVKLELRLDPERATRNRGFDPFTIAVRDRATLDRWAAYLDGLGVGRSPVVAAIRAWLVAFDDPDGNRLRLYTLESHGPEIEPDEHNPWVEG